VDGFDGDGYGGRAMNWKKVVGWILFVPFAIIVVVTVIIGACLLVVGIIVEAVDGDKGAILLIMVVLGVCGGIILVSQEGK